MFAIKNTLRSIGLGAVLVAAALSAQAAVVHVRSGDYMADISVGNLNNSLSILPTSIVLSNGNVSSNSFVPDSFFEEALPYVRWGNFGGAGNHGFIAFFGINSTATWEQIISNNNVTSANGMIFEATSGDTVSLVYSSGPISFSVSDATPVPAPLPILGAVSALGWSRKLRRRIRESQAQA